MSIPHSKLGASSAHRWLTCPASVRMQEGEKDKAGFAANEGTAAHALAEEALRQGEHPSKFIGQTFEGFIVDNEMAHNVGLYFGYVSEIFMNEEGEDLLIEQQLRYDKWVPKGFGTADAIVITSSGIAHVIDLKYGKGVAVYADENPQGMLYALGVLQEYEWLHDIHEFVIHIVQPRIGNYSEWSITTDRLMDFGDYARQRAALVKTNDAPFGPSDKACQWCKAQSRCEALAKHNFEVIGSDFDNLDMLELSVPNKLSNDQLAQIIPNTGLIKGWLDAIQEKVLDEALAGTMPGYKAVAGRSIRRWDNVEVAEKFLRQTRKLKVDQAYTKKLISPTQAEKIIGKKDSKLQALIVKPEGKPTLAPADDKRPAINNSDDFDDLS